jgi:hypothetical protein
MTILIHLWRSKLEGQLLLFSANCILFQTYHLPTFHARPTGRLHQCIFQISIPDLITGVITSRKQQGQY